MTKILSKTARLFFIMCIIYLGGAMVLFPHKCLSAGKAAAELCLTAVIPSLFPFFICSGLFTALGLARLCSRFLSPVMRPLFNVPGAGALAFVIGIVSGYPMGAVCAAELFSCGECTKGEAERLTAFCSNSGPLFIMGVVGCGILSDPRLGKYLYAAHIISAIMTGLLFRFWKSRKTRTVPTLPPSAPSIKNTAEAIGSVVDNSIFSMLKVCAFVLIFSVLVSVLPSSPYTPYIHALLEITGGTAAAAKAVSDPDLCLPLLSFFIAFSGVSVMFQVSSTIAPHGLSIAPYILGKLTHGALSFAVTRLLLTYFPITQTAFAESISDGTAAVFPPSRLFLAALASMTVCAAALFLACRAAQFISGLTRKGA